MILLKNNKKIIISSENCLNKYGYNFIHFFIGKHKYKHTDSIKASMIENRLIKRGFKEV